MLLCRLLNVFKINFFEKFFPEYNQSVSLDPDQAQHFVRPDLGINCLQRLSADNTSMQRVNISWVVVSNTYLNYLHAAGKTSVFGVKMGKF